MIRILFFVAVVFALGLGFAWLADRPGDMVVTFEGYRYQVSLMVAAVAVAAVVAAVMILWWLVKAIWNSPYAVARHFRARRRDRGYQALSTGMIAAGAGDGALARKKNREAAKLISADQEPLIHLLDAQAALLEGDHEAARAKFEAMLDDPETRLLGLRGLYLEAERLGERVAARHYAARAAESAPQLSWAADVALGEKSEDGDWDGALKLLDAVKPVRQAERDDAARRRAVLLTAKAISVMDTDPTGARAAAIEANRLDPRLPPAAVAAAKTLIRNNDVRRAAKVLEASWKAEPHPEVAELYVHARPGDAVLDRLARAKRLQSLKRNNVESSLAVARAALDAGDYRLARDEAQAAIRMQPREGAYLLLADIEEAETGDPGRVRQWLAKAVRAPRDPAWVADGVVSERWAPVSPVSGRLGAFEWRVPMERLGQLIEQDEPEQASPAAAPPQIAAPPAAPPPVVVEAAPVEWAAPSPAVAEPVQTPAKPEPEKVVGVVPAPAPVAAVAAEQDEEMVTAPPSPAPLPTPTPSGPAMVVPLRPPDDPGVDPDEAGQAPAKRFRLF